MGQEYFSLEFWRQILSNDFNRGFAFAIAMVLAIIIFFIFLKILLLLFFRTGRSSTIIIKDPTGDLVITRDAVEASARVVLDRFAQLDVERIHLYRRGGIYILQINCCFIQGPQGLPVIIGEVKPQLLDELALTLGVNNIKEIKIRVESVNTERAASEPVESPVFHEINSGF